MTASLRRSPLLLVLGLVLAGCVAQGPAYDPAALPPLAAASARILVFRESGIIGAATTIPVSVDGQASADLAQDGYALLDVPAGRHELSAPNWMGTSRLVLDLAPGSVAYVEAGWGPLAGNLFVGPPPSAQGAVDSAEEGPYRLTLVDPALAADALASARLSP